MKKVLAIAPYPYLPFFSGGQKFIAQFFEWLGKETELTVISTLKNEASLAKTYRLIPLLKNSFSRYFDSSLVRKISKEVKDGGYDTVIWEHPYYAWLANRVKKRTGTRMIIHTHNIEYQRFRSTGRWWWPILKRYEKWSFKKADNIFFITPEDRDFAIQNWKIKKEKCIDLPFGIDIEIFPGDRATSREQICSKHGIAGDKKILFFNGLLNYKPNLDGLKAILNNINPLLLEAQGFNYTIIICGKGLPAELNSLTEYANKNIIYAGFTDAIAMYYKAADIFLNPVQSGGGIKTKMVESIAYGTTVISTLSGAAGMDPAVCGNKLVTVADNDWKAFAGKVVENANIVSTTPADYYKKYSWVNVIKKLLTDLA